ncbi:hypothetical protein D3C76_1239940 [compost metagenome]
MFSKTVHAATEHFAQLVGVGFNQPGCTLQPGAQGFATAVQSDLQAHGLELFQQLPQPLRAEATRQTAGHHHRIMARRDMR